MKKLLSLILCLMLCLPVLAMAETVDTAPELYTIDFGTFTMNLAGDDLYEVADEMVNASVYAIIYPGYDETAVSHDTINVVWTQEDAAASLNLYGPEVYAQAVLNSAKPQYELMGIKMNNAQVLSAIFEDDIFAAITYTELDYTGAGVELVTPLYQMQVYFCMGDAGTYVFTVTSTSMEQLEALSAYLDSVNFK